MMIGHATNRPSTPRWPATQRVVGAIFVAAVHIAVLWALLLHRDSSSADLNASRRAQTDSEIEMSLAPAGSTGSARAAAQQKPEPARSVPGLARPSNPAPPRQSPGHSPDETEEAADPSTARYPVSGPHESSPAPAVGLSADAASDFQRALLAHIESYRRYPDQTKGLRPQGTVQIVFAMDRQGKVLGIWIDRSSGSDALDREAIATVLRAQPLPAIPPDLPEPLNIVLPVVFGSPP